VIILGNDSHLIKIFFHYLLGMAEKNYENFWRGYKPCVDTTKFNSIQKELKFHTYKM
jgi:hypothetical protein